jgi:hypothetical protein
MGHAMVMVWLHLTTARHDNRALPRTSDSALQRRSRLVSVLLLTSPYATSVSTPASRTPCLPKRRQRSASLAASARAKCSVPSSITCPPPPAEHISASSTRVGTQPAALRGAGGTVVSSGLSTLKYWSERLCAASADASRTSDLIPRSVLPRSSTRRVVFFSSMAASACPPASPSGLNARFSTSSTAPHPSPNTATQSVGAVLAGCTSSRRSTQRL